MTMVPPREILSNLLTELLGHMPGIRDGNAESVHDGRVATRRLREVLPLVGAAHPERVDAFTTAIRRAGRRLGRVRELDVMRDQLGHLEQRYPDGAIAVAVARRTLAERQERARRRLIKSLERLRLDRVGKGALASPGPLSLVRHPTRAFTDWSATLRKRIAARARDLRDAVDHGSGVYFPNRMHATRIAAKKLRYSVELAEQTGLWRPPRLLRDLRRIQATLGELHDAQVLLDRLAALVPRAAAGNQDRTVLASALRSDIDGYHHEYLTKRDRLRAICAACVRFTENGAQRAWMLPRPLVAASVVTVPAGLFLIAGRRAS
ncbi:MAG TPA: CHAD domain-containing protein [Vicinamibacterales bacterium]